MQRRAATAYFIIFVLVGVGSYAFMQVAMAKPPDVDLDGPTYSGGDQFQVGDETFTVEKLEAKTSEGEISYTGKLTYVNESYVHTTKITVNETLTYPQNETYTAKIRNRTGERVLVLVENATRNGSDVKGPFTENDTVPISPESGTVSATLVNVTSDRAKLEYVAPKTVSVPLAGGANVTLSGKTHLVYFVSENAVKILPTTEFYSTYHTQLQKIEAWHNRKTALWAVVFFMFIGGAILFMSALMPPKD